jgi:hypothetical protein
VDGEVIWVGREPKYFCGKGWTGESAICPSGGQLRELTAQSGAEATILTSLMRSWKMIARAFSVSIESKRRLYFLF